MKFLISKLQRRTGFTLLEVVVTLAIVGLGVVTLFEIFSSGLRLGGRSFATSEAIAYSRQAIDDLLIRPRISDGGEAGSFNGRYRWDAQIKSFPSGDPLSPAPWELKEVTLKMRFRDGGRDKEIEMKTLRLVKGQGR